MDLLMLLMAALLVTTSTQQENGQEDVPGIKVPASRLTRSTIPGTCTANGDIICATCTSLSICINGNPAAEANCSGAFPYCSPGAVQASCSDTPAAGCGGNNDVGGTAIVCPSVGIFPG